MGMRVSTQSTQKGTVWRVIGFNGRAKCKAQTRPNMATFAWGREGWEARTWPTGPGVGLPESRPEKPRRRFL